MKVLLCILSLICALSFSALAQNKPKPTASAAAGNGDVANGASLSGDGETKKAKPTPKESKPAPAVVEFTPDQQEKLAKHYTRTRIAILEAENLRLEIESLQARLPKVNENMQMVRTAYVELLQALSELHGVKKEDLVNYQVVTPDTAFGLRRNANAPPAGEGKAAAKPE